MPPLCRCPAATALQVESRCPTQVSRSPQSRSYRGAPLSLGPVASRPAFLRPWGRASAFLGPRGADASAADAGSTPKSAHPPRASSAAQGPPPPARRPLAGCHVTLRGNQELRRAAGGRGRRRVRKGATRRSPHPAGRDEAHRDFTSPGRPLGSCRRRGAGQGRPAPRGLGGPHLPRTRAPRGPGRRSRGWQLEPGPGQGVAEQAVGARGGLTSNMSPSRKTIATQETMSA